MQWARKEEVTKNHSAMKCGCQILQCLHFQWAPICSLIIEGGEPSPDSIHQNPHNFLKNDSLQSGMLPAYCLFGCGQIHLLTWKLLCTKTIPLSTLMFNTVMNLNPWWLHHQVAPSCWPMCR
jgi:hypothetical protein